MRNMFNVFLFIPLFGIGQVIDRSGDSVGEGIHFEQGVTWHEVLARARKENKYVFVDCFATWCGPCKNMDKNIYPKDSVGEFMNPRFISIKVQMDSSRLDNDWTRSWYSDAHSIMKDYRVSAYPTLLFFSSNGEIIHRGLGYKSVGAFIDLASKAIDSTKQYYTLLHYYKLGQKNYSVMPYLAASAIALDERVIADSIGADYLHNYLDKLSIVEFCTKANLDFIAKFSRILSSKDEVFEYILHNVSTADSIDDKVGFSRQIVSSLIFKENITPAMECAKRDGMQPPWNKMSRDICRKFGSEYVEENVIIAKLKWYHSASNWKDYIKSLIKYTDMQDLQKIPGNMFNQEILNNNAWDVFNHSRKKKYLERALTWSDRAIQMESPPSAYILDTKANLLYKLGKTEVALKLERVAAAMPPSKYKEVIDDNLQKMEHGESTWAVR